MSIKRQQNWLPQQRVDVPHLRAVESSIANDFDLLAGQIIGAGYPLVIKGLSIPFVSGPANALTLEMYGAVLMHYGASEAGTIFATNSTASDLQVLSSSNGKVVGDFVSNTTNYVGLDLIRSPDSSTNDFVQFYNETTKLENSLSVPLARTLSYKIVISTQPFSSSTTVLPIATVAVNGIGVVTQIKDARRMLFRLGSGGDNASATSSYTWRASRTENSIITGSAGVNAFSGEDKLFTGLKDWMDAIMTSVWELRGGNYWYSNQSRDNVRLVYGGGLGTLTDNFTFDGTTLRWKKLTITFENSVTASYNVLTDNPVTGVAFPDGSCLYADIDRTSNTTLVSPAISVAPLATVGSSTIPGRRIILAWRVGTMVYSRDRGYEVGRILTVAPATNSIIGGVYLNAAAPTPATPVVPVILANGQVEITATANNSHAIKGTGFNAGPGIWGIGHWGVFGQGIDGNSSVGGIFSGSVYTGTNVAQSALYAFSSSGTSTTTSQKPTVVISGIGKSDAGVDARKVPLALQVTCFSGNSTQVNAAGFYSSDKGIGLVATAGDISLMGSSYPENTSSSYPGVAFFAKSFAGKAIVAEAGDSTQYAIYAPVGGVGVDPASDVKFIGSKNGCLWVAATEFIEMAGSSAMSINSINGMFVRTISAAQSYLLGAQIRIPKNGAWITKLELVYSTGTSGSGCAWKPYVFSIKNRAVYPTNSTLMVDNIIGDSAFSLGSIAMPDTVNTQTLTYKSSSPDYTTNTSITSATGRLSGPEVDGENGYIGCQLSITSTSGYTGYLFGIRITYNYTDIGAPL